MKNYQKQWVAVILILAGAGIVTWYAWPKYPPSPAAGDDTGAVEASDSEGAPEPKRGPAPSEDRISVTRRPAERIRTVERPEKIEVPETVRAPKIPQTTTQPIKPTDDRDGRKAYARGMDLMKTGKLIEARAELSRALNSGGLDETRASAARDALTELANKTIFSPTVYKDDPYTFSYKFQPGDRLVRVERRLTLRVPSQIVLKVNGIADATKIRGGQTLKMIRGPFHAVIHKSKFIMDVYLHDTFVRRFKIGIGAPETPTPVGYFRVRLGGKLRNAPYTPPPSTALPQRAILPGEPGYPLDDGGHWISLTGIPQKGTNLTHENGYGIHGTPDPSSIGKAASHGCIRLSHKDIDLVFAMLYEKWSTVTIKE